ncbi:Ribose-5-phosphate isomerase [Mycena venus]|uniref:Ribose-5-phosphate isomerase n=1 Tax=Mycena venus TaxID=2733690 RepID=A0A8H6Z4C3_9AGAR|nr:Ribose-5-phosphate isomerase [Mycena venus]
MYRSLARLLWGALKPSISTMPLPTPVPLSPVSPIRPVVLSRIGQPTKLVSPIKIPNLSVLERSKQLAAWTAVDQHVKPEHRVIGIGSGSTVPYVVERIVQLGAAANQERVFIPTAKFPTIDITLDGADEVDHNLNCIKGGGACHLREKVLAEAANTFILVADFRKNVEYLGTNYTPGVPIEVVPFAYAKVLQNLHHAFECPKASLRMAVKKGRFHIPLRFDYAPFELERMKEPHIIMTQIKMLTGVVEVGLFCNMAKAAYFGNEDGSVTIKTDDGRVEQVPASQ